MPVWDVGLGAIHNALCGAWPLRSEAATLEDFNQGLTGLMPWDRARLSCYHHTC